MTESTTSGTGTSLISRLRERGVFRVAASYASLHQVCLAVAAVQLECAVEVRQHEPVERVRVGIRPVMTSTDSIRLDG